MFIVGILVVLAVPMFALYASVSNVFYVVLLTFVANKKTNNLPLSAVYSMLSIVIAILAAGAINILFTLIDLFSGFNLTERDVVIESILISLVYMLIAFMLSFVTSSLIGKKIFNKIFIFDENTQKRLSIHLFIGTVIIITFFFLLTFFHDIMLTFGVHHIFYTASLSLIFLYFLYTIFIYADNEKKSEELTKKDNMLKNLNEYTNYVEQTAEGARIFRHEHRNLLLTFNTYLDEGDLEKLRESYKSYVNLFNSESAEIEECINRLGRIKNPELKSLISAKCTEAINKHIKMSIEINEEIVLYDAHNIVDLCRCVGVLTDNAIEACFGHNGAEIRFFASKKDNIVTVVFENTCLTKPQLNKIGKKGYSTKQGEGRGLGIYGLNQKIKYNKNIRFETYCKNNMFIQTIFINDTK